jgi:uncharacterized membrane protein
MEEQFRMIAATLALSVETLAAILIAVGAADAITGLVRGSTDVRRPLTAKRRVWVRFGTWLLLGLEFELAADIIRTAISPTWHQTGQLAAIAAIRTFLNYFLEKDIERYSEYDNLAAKPPSRIDAA